MSVKNGGNCLKGSIESILNQTFTSWELIICNDGSTDLTASILDEYVLRDKRIKVITNDKSMGLAYSLNRCISESLSDILARQDADDASALDRFEKQYPFVVSHPEYAIVGTCWYSKDNNGVCKKISVIESPTAKDMIKGGLFLHPTWMMQKKALSMVGNYTVNNYTMRSQDYHLVMKLYAAGCTMFNLNDYLYYYTNDDSTMNRSHNWKRVKGLMWIRYDSYKRNRFPLWAYFYVFKPVVANLVPRQIMFRYYQSKSKV